MHQIDDAVVRGGQLVLSGLPFAEGQHVRIIVAERDAKVASRTIKEVRELLRNAVEHFEEPFEPMIPTDNWEMLK